MKTKLSLLALALFATTTVALAKSPLDPILEAFEKAEYREAIDLAAKSSFEDKTLSARAAYVIGECHMALGEFGSAERAFRRVVEVKPKAVPGWTGIARSLLRRGKGSEAQEVAEKAVELDPKNAEAQRTLGESYLAQKNERRAKKPLETAYKIDRKDPLTARALFEYHLQGDRLPKAKAVADRLSKDRGKHPMGWFLRGVVADRDGKDEDAIGLYEKAIALDDTFIDAHKNLAILCTAKNPLYRDKERTAKAMAHYKRYFDLGGKDPELKQVYDTLTSFFASVRR